MLLFVFPFLLLNSAFAAMNLKEAFEAARVNMETLKSADAVINQKIARKNQAISVGLPNIAGVGSHTWIDRPHINPGVSSAFTLTKQYTGAIRVQQAILRGGVIAAYQLSKEDILLAQFQKDASEINLYQLVINAYYSLYAAQVDLVILDELVKYSRDRVKELKGFTDVGRSRRGELVQAQSQLLSAESDYQNGIQVLNQAEETFEFYTNTRPKELTPPSDVPKELSALPEYINKMRTRPDIMAKIQTIKVAEKQVDVSKGGHMPSLDFIGNYYITRTGVLQTSKWDVGLAVTIPLFQGGLIINQVKESVEKKRVAELDASQTVRAAERDLAILYQNHFQIQDRLATMKDALVRAEEGYKLNKRDYSFGQNTNLDVLQSLNLYIGTKRAYTTLTSMAAMTYKNLEASTGVLP
jgi:outer membrane protein